MRLGKDEEMSQTIKSMAAFCAVTLLLVFSAAALTGCEVMRYAAKCTLTQPQNCN